MAVPKQKTSRSKRNSRRAHDSINKVSISYDSVTGEPKLPHHLSLKDGYYNSKQIVKRKLKGKDDEDKSQIENNDFKIIKGKTQTDSKSKSTSKIKDK